MMSIYSVFLLCYTFCSTKVFFRQPVLPAKMLVIQLKNRRFCMWSKTLASFSSSPICAETLTWTHNHPNQFKAELRWFLSLSKCLTLSTTHAALQRGLQHGAIKTCQEPWLQKKTSTTWIMMLPVFRTWRQTPLSYRRSRLMGNPLSGMKWWMASYRLPWCKRMTSIKPQGNDSFEKFCSKREWVKISESEMGGFRPVWPLSLGFPRHSQRTHKMSSASLPHSSGVCVRGMGHCDIWLKFRGDVTAQELVVSVLPE